jgi:hypothetical protein
MSGCSSSIKEDGGNVFEKTGGHGGSTAKERRNLKRTRGRRHAGHVGHVH